MSYKQGDKLGLEYHIQKNVRQRNMNLFGAIQLLQQGAVLNDLSPLNVQKGIGKLVFVVNAGLDLVGDFTITGTSVDRDTMAETAFDTDVISINGATTDNSGVDLNGFNVFDWTSAYISSKWFYGTIGTPIVLSTIFGGVSISNFDIYHISFHQFNDLPNLNVSGFDISAKATNTNAAISANLYSVRPTSGDMVDLKAEESIIRTSAKIEPGFYQRFKLATDFDIDGTTEGVLVEMFLDRDAQSDWEDMNIYVHVEQRLAL